ncbi:MAG TPA: methylamine utilization protein [Gallionella sp.]|jgi:plastocyanin|nr:MAG: methylamine utilization protein [Gallionellales bacterium GWA2_54_124]OGT20359.1 MAG: methylamine utilization protein [Gallionellales bacterium RIFOXYD12_FULL_53_10]HCI52476.1 methylamine utilization protein [Gallionella sp.]
MKLLAMLTLTLLSSTAFSAEYLIEQKDKKFTKKELKLKVGDVIEFKNSDPFNHNVFSLSDAQTFDLGSYPQGQSKKVTFTQAGKVEVECAIHPEMKLNVEVNK